MKALVEDLNTRWWFKIVFAILIYVGGPLGFLASAIPILLIRSIAIFTAPYLRPHLTRIISPESGLTSLDDYQGEPKHVVVGLHYMDRPISFKDVTDTFKQILENGKVCIELCVE